MSVIDIAVPPNPVVPSTQADYLAVCGSSSPYYKLYYQGTLVTVADDLPPGAAQGIAINPQKTVMMIVTYASPYVTFYTLDAGNKPVKISNPATLPPDAAECCCWSPEGRYAAVGHDTSPYVTIYDFNSGSPVKVSNPSSLPTSRPQNECLAWNGPSDNDSMLAAAVRSTPYCHAWTFDGSTFDVCTNPGTVPANIPNGCDVNDDGDRLFISSSDGTNPIYLASRSGTTLTKLAYPAAMGGAARSGKFINGGAHLIVGNGSTLDRYSFDGTTATRITSPSLSSVGTTMTSSFYHKPSGALFCGGGSSTLRNYQAVDGLGEVFSHTAYAAANTPSTSLTNNNGISLV